MIHPLLLLFGLAGAEQVIDDFQYADVNAARQAWVAKDGTPPVELLEGNEPPGLKVVAPFATRRELKRTVIDREVQLDLAVPGQFRLEVASDVPEALAHLTFYFRSGNGWYARDGSLREKGWHGLRFSKASFRTEGSPTGWHKIDGIRIAAWRNRAQDASLRVRHLAAVTHDVALVTPSRSAGAMGGSSALAGGDDPEIKTALETADRVSGMLAELGLEADAIDQSAIVHGALGSRRVAVLAYNPRLTKGAVAGLERFVKGGGKLLVCYRLPERLGRLLGFGGQQYVRQKRPGHFAEIRFDATDIAGLPKRVRQASWNVTTAEPSGHGARVIGRWFDDAGKPTGRAAMLVSDRGAFFTHIVLSDDHTGKKQLLAAVLGRLAPPLWQQMAQHAMDRSVEVGHCSGVQEVSECVRASGNAEALECLQAALRSRKRVEEKVAGREYPEAVELAQGTHALLVEAYIRAPPSPAREGRAVWNHSGSGAYPGDWERSAKELAAAGFNMVLPNMLWGGRAHYPSDVLPRSSTFEQYGDQIEQCVAAAKKHSLEVHVWKVNYNLSGAPREFVEKLRREGRLQMTAQGEPHEWLCPSHPENQQLELESMLEVGRKYAVDGLHFDYIRYPGRQYCFCPGCRERFEAESGRKVADWPKDCYSGARQEEYTDWRCRQITWLVEAVHREAKKLRRESPLMISAAVFGSYPACRQSVSQDWPEWVKAGYLDFVCPMDYTTSDRQFTGLVENQLKLVDGRIPVYPGIGAWRLTHDRVVGQIHHARSLGAPGFTIFNFTSSAAETVIPAVGLGAGVNKAVPPHRQ